MKSAVLCQSEVLCLNESEMEICEGHGNPL